MVKKMVMPDKLWFNGVRTITLRSAPVLFTVNAEHIGAMYVNNPGTTRIYVQDKPFIVVETPEEILALIERAAVI